MPYIRPGDRLELDDWRKPATPGELNYAITRIIHDYVDRHGESYQAFNDVMGALTGVQFEFYRRKVASYEDLKIQQNGDI